MSQLHNARRVRDQCEALLVERRATMRAEHKSPKRITAYELAVIQLVAHLAEGDRLVHVSELTRTEM